MRNEDLGKLILRLSVGFLLFLHGITKLENLDFIKGGLEAADLPTFLAYGVWIGEIVCPILIILGFFTRPAALIITINMIFAVYLVYKDQVFERKPMGGGAAIELELLFMLGALAIFFMGAGRYAVSKGKWN